MDYKELIRILRDEDRGDVLDWVDDAADAIETLLAERDALLTVSHGKCELCANFADCRSDARARIDCLSNLCKNWKWRGPQKEGTI